MEESITLKDLQLMKENNINDILCSHYPKKDSFYTLCDRLDLYVVDETNIEVQGMGTTNQGPFDMTVHPVYLPEWTGAFLDRTERMYESSKNHPSIIIWSLGNEAGNGQNQVASYNWLKSGQSSGPVQYEGATHFSNSNFQVPMYWKFEDMIAYAENTPGRPLIQCEYSHAMGNSVENLQDYWDVIESYDIMQGGFNLDWVDQGILAQNENGKDYWTYGAQLGSEHLQHDYNFCLNGLIDADRTPHPALFEVKKVYQFIKFRNFALETNTIEIANGYDFKNLSDFIISWEITKDGKPYATGGLSELDIAPGGSRRVDLNRSNFDQTSGEFLLNLRANLRVEKPLLSVGSELAAEQFALSSYKFAADMPISKESISSQLEGKNLTINGSGLKVVFDSQTGALSELNDSDKNILKEALRPNFWRTQTDNDFGYRMPQTHAVWKKTTETQKLVRRSLA
ncbi:glycoside hydrolase family 2 TIM barrel-domain containing protein [Pelagicoccus sp. SDUM812002]|uniref:glycoside hydrolase family 2 TIM barrel-domain containing protein n=1 Tax=Pelagicoccus sp. SDUM812002 TaxID=3041266 RepID=UPI00281003C6|nr:glycoside hydrolase family 2 TIM barrel-domain containing protein [Pelagicoccus sp. SDUM812002]MDQ8184210.1 glycoside hydrolase family 2 TIM barrel-domain containing protein [Pelagicoccus sp. SDUM812002]